MKKILFLAVLLLSQVVMATTADATKPRYIWIDACANFVEFADSKENIARDLQKAYDAGFTDVVVDVRNTLGDVLFKTDVVDQVTKLPTWDGGSYHYHERTATWDYLQAFIDAGHEIGLKVHAGINTFVGGCSYSYGLGELGLVFRDETKRDWVTTLYLDNDGDGTKELLNALDVASYSEKFLNPANDEVQEFLLSMLRDLAKYDVDGIFLDRCRYIDAYSDFSDVSKTKFEEYLDSTISDFPQSIETSYQKQWWAFRAKVIHDFVVKAREAVKSVNSNIQFGTYVGAWYSSYYEVGVNWASTNYNAAANYSWASPEWNNYGYADHLDFMLLGAYAPANAIYGTTEWTCQGFCQLAKEKLMGDVLFAGGPDVGNGTGYENGGQGEAVTKTIDACMNSSDGYFLFDMVHVRKYDYWDAVKTGFTNLDISVPSDEPYIHASSYNVNLTCSKGQTATAEVTVDGYLLNRWTTVEVVSPESGLFSVSPSGLNVSGYTHDFDPENPTITIKFSPTEAGTWGGDVDGDGYNDYYVVLHSIDVDGNDVYQWIAITGTATDSSTTTNPYISVTPNKLNFSCNVGETETAEVTVDGYLLNRWTTVEVESPEEGIFSVTPAGLNVSGYTHDFDPENPTITIKFSPTEAGSWGGDVDGDGYNDYYVVLHSIDVDGNDVYQWVILNGTATSTSSIEDIDNNSIEVRVSGNSLYATGQVSAIDIYSVTGFLEAKSAGESINLSDLAPGIYIVKVTDNSGYVHTIKISHSK